MFQGMKKLRELRKEAREIEAEYDRAGKELIRMQVKEDSGFLSPYCLQGEPVVSSEVSDFLDNAVKRLPFGPSCTSRSRGTPLTSRSARSTPRPSGIIIVLR